MEVQLLDPEKKSRKWRSVRKFFQRKNKQQIGDLKYFAGIDKVYDHQDQTTVNLSNASDSNNRSEDEHSLDSASGVSQSPSNRNFGTSLRTTPCKTASSTAASGQTYAPSLTDDYMQFDSSPTERSDSILNASVSSRTSSINSTLLVRKRSFCSGTKIHRDNDLSASKVLLDLNDDHGTEVVLFESTEAEDDIFENESTEEGIFLSLRSPLNHSRSCDAITTKQPFHRTISDPDHASDRVASRSPVLTEFLDALQIREIKQTRERDVSPTVSKDMTWVSHDDDFEDARPVKEIMIPFFSEDTLHDSSETNSHSNLFYHEEVAKEIRADISRSREEVRDAIFASLEDEEDEIVLASPDAILLSQPKVKEDDALNNSTLGSASVSPGTAENKTYPVYSPSENNVLESDMGQKLDGTAALLAPSIPESFTSSPHTFSSTSCRKSAHSTAFLKRKSAFTGQDLLTEEAEKFAAFLEEAGELDLSAIPQDVSLDSPLNDHFVVTLRASSTDEDGFPTFSSISNLTEEPIPPSVNQVMPNENSHSSHTSSGTMLSKSEVSEEHGCESSSNSHGNSFPSYSPSYTHSVHGPSPDEVLCGGLFTEDILDNEFDGDVDDEEDDSGYQGCESSSHLSDRWKKRYNNTSRHRDRHHHHCNRRSKQPLSLEDIQTELINTVQEFARSASSNMMKFLQK